MSEQQDQGLMLGDRINWPYILGLCTLKVDETIIKYEGAQSEQEVREAVLAVRDKIPDDWIKNDKQWDEDMEKAIIKVKVDARRLWCGVRVGKPKFRKEEKIDPHRLLRACVNVFQRRGLLSKKIFQEVMIPTPEDFEEEEK